MEEEGVRMEEEAPTGEVDHTAEAVAEGSTAGEEAEVTSVTVTEDQYPSRRARKWM